MSVAAVHLSFVFVGERNGLHPVRAGDVLHERPVDGEENAIDAHLEDGAEQNGGGEEAAGGDVEVLAEGALELDGLLARWDNSAEGQSHVGRLAF